MESASDYTRLQTLVWTLSVNNLYGSARDFKPLRPEQNTSRQH
jgi:hypothetical protein